MQTTTDPTQPISPAKQRFIVVFDGVCNLCNSWVSFIARNDKRNVFSFAFAQSDLGQKLLREAGCSTNDFETMLLVSPNNVLQKSSAAIHIISNFGGWWRLFGLFTLIPKPLRDFIYNLIARNRYRIFGRTNICTVTDQIRSRMLM